MSTFLQNVAAEKMNRSQTQSGMTTPIQRPTMYVVESDTDQETPNEGVVPPHNDLMDRVAASEGSMLIDVSKLFDHMRCPLTDEFVTPSVDNELRKASCFMKPHVVTQSPLKDFDSVSSHIVVVTFDDDDNPNGVIIYGERLTKKNVEYLNKHTDKWQWVRMNKHKQEVTVPWDASMGASRLNINETHEHSDESAFT